MNPPRSPKMFKYIIDINLQDTLNIKIIIKRRNGVLF